MHSLFSIGRGSAKTLSRRFSAGMLLTSLAVCVGFPATTGGVAFGAPEPDSALAGMAIAPAVQIQRVSFSDCDAAGNREVRVVPGLVPADARDVIVQWYLDGEPVGPAGTPSPFFGSFPADGRSHLVEVRTLTPPGATGASEEVEVADCATVVGDVRTVEPARVLDTRSNGRTADGVAEGVGRLGAASSIEVDIGGRAGSPGNTSAAVINLTAINPSTKGFATAYPCTDQVPNASTINYSQGVNIANSTTVKLSDSGALCVYTSAESDFAIDLVGFVPAESEFETVNPTRLLDTRPNGETIDGQARGPRVERETVREIDVGQPWPDTS